MVPFFQSMICNIDDCQNASQYEDIPTYPASRLVSIEKQYYLFEKKKVEKRTQIFLITEKLS